MEPPERSPDRDDFGIQLKWPAGGEEEPGDAGDEATPDPLRRAPPSRREPLRGQADVPGRVVRGAQNVASRGAGASASTRPPERPVRPESRPENPGPERPSRAGDTGPERPSRAGTTPERSTRSDAPRPRASNSPSPPAGAASAGSTSGRPSTTLGALSDRVERISGALVSLSRQVDEHAAEQARVVKDYRRGVDRVLNDLGRAVKEVSEAVQQMAVRIDELRSQPPAAGREVLDAVLALHDDAYNELTSLREGMGALGSSVEQLAAKDDDDGDTAEHALAGPLTEIRSHLVKLGEVPSQLAGLEKLASAVGSIGDLTDFHETLGAVHKELVGLRRSLTMLSRNGLALGDDQVDALAEAVAARLAERPALLRPEQLSILAEAVVDRLEQSFEVVDDEGSHAT